MKIILVLFFSFMLAGYGSDLFTQTKSIHPPDKEISYDKPPGVIKQAPVVYPPSMLDAGWEAIVYIKAFITTEGTVGDTKIEKVEVKAKKIVINEKENDTSGQMIQTDGKAFEESALTSVHQWKFTPAQMQGKPVAVWITIPFRFKLSGEKGKTPDKDADNEKMEKTVESIKENIENILKGTDIEKAKKFVNKNALLVYNKETVNLYSVLNGENKNIRLIEGKDTKCMFANIESYDANSSMLVVWKSGASKGKIERVHTILLSKTSSNEWKVVHWHISS